MDISPSTLHILQEPFPILGRSLSSLDCSEIDLSQGHLEEIGLDPTDLEAFSAYVFSHPYRIGGYLEKRNLYRSTNHFGTGMFQRNIHLGVDLWAREGTALYCPIDGVIHSLHDNEGDGDYGPTIILEHNSGEQSFYSLYGHLCRSTLLELHIGHTLTAGDPMGTIGADSENGDWPSHVHVQLIRDLEWNTHDYPGVCAKKDLKWYRVNCPDSRVIIR